METKKMILPTVIAVVTLVVLVAGATYAYFAVNVTNNFGTRTITANAAQVGTVVLTQGSDLSLTVSAVDMMNPASEETQPSYYATVGTTTPNYVTTQAAAPVMATASTTSSNTFNCTYTLNAAFSGTMITALKAMTSPEPTTGQLILTLNGTDYDLFSTTSPINLTSQTLNGITNGTSRTITAQLRLVNLYGSNGNNVAASQNDLAGTTATVTITVPSFTCTAV